MQRFMKLFSLVMLVMMEIMTPISYATSWETIEESQKVLEETTEVAESKEEISEAVEPKEEILETVEPKEAILEAVDIKEEISEVVESKEESLALDGLLEGALSEDLIDWWLEKQTDDNAYNGLMDLVYFTLNDSEYTKIFDVEYPDGEIFYTLNWNNKEIFTAGVISITDWRDTITMLDRNLWATLTNGWWDLQHLF